MVSSADDARHLALNVARTLVERGREEDAVSLLSAWAAVGPDDAIAQSLLVEARRLNPHAKIAELAFERLAGLSARNKLLDAAIARFARVEVERLAAELAPPMRAPITTNLTHRDASYRIQTEDLGTDEARVVTDLFTEDGRLAKRVERSYAESIKADADLDARVRELMNGQHLETTLALRDGLLDGLLDGSAGESVDKPLAPPAPAPERIAHRRDAPSPAPEPTAPTEGALALRFRLHVLRSPDPNCPAVLRGQGDDVLLGSGGDIALPGDRFCHAREGVITYREGSYRLTTFERGNGIYSRVRQRASVDVGDSLLVGDHVVVITRNPDYDFSPGPGPTYRYSSPARPSAFRVVQVLEGGSIGACATARGTTLYIGSGRADLTLRGDARVAEQHCVIDQQAGAILLTCLGSAIGVFVRVDGESDLHDGDELVIGRTRLRVELNGAAAPSESA